jgi:hypothetical protein
MTTLALLVRLVLAAAPAELAERPQPGGTTETVNERRARLEQIAADAWHVARIDEPLPWRTRQETAIVLLALACHESSFRLDVDADRCSTDPREGDCDGGRAKCLLQIHPASADEAVEVNGSRIGCFRAGLRRVRASVRTCTAPGAALALYTGGQCEEPTAIASSREHLATIHDWMARARR